MYNISEITQFFNDSGKFHGAVRTGESLASHTTMNVGGKAGVFIEPEDKDSLLLAASALTERGVDFFVLGGGSNVIISDDGLDAVISTRKMSGVKIDGGGQFRISAESGASWGSLLSFCGKNNIGGFEAFSGLSGTVGGALFMNASCFGLSACDNLVSAEYLDLSDMRVRTYEKRSDDWGYKKSPFQSRVRDSKSLSRLVILSAVFDAHHGFDPRRAEECVEERRRRGHFNAPSAGSAFKNGGEVAAGKIIDECGLKGFSIGGARVAPWHGNLIINPEGKAAASEIKELLESVRRIVLERKGVSLESEILFVGF